MIGSLMITEFMEKATNVWPLPMIGQSYTETSHTQVFDYTTEVKAESTLPGIK